MSEKKFEFEGKQYFIGKITSKIVDAAQNIYNRAFREGVEAKALMRASLDKHMKDQGLWSDQKDNEYQDMIKKIAELEFKLNSGGLKVSEGKAIALELSKIRGELLQLISVKNSMDNLTAEGMAENKRFNYLVSACIIDYLTNKPVFSSYEDYVENKDSELARKAAAHFAEFLYGVRPDYEESLVEYKFLKRFKFIDEKGRFIDKEGKLIDSDGNYINDEGYRVDKDGNRIDINGNPVLEVTVETAEFMED